MTKQPLSCSLRNARRLSVIEGFAMVHLQNGQGTCHDCTLWDNGIGVRPRSAHTELIFMD